MGGFVSKAQVRHMWKSNPELARKMTEQTLDMRRLPEHIKPKQNVKTKTRNGKKI